MKNGRIIIGNRIPPKLNLNELRNNSPVEIIESEPTLTYEDLANLANPNIKIDKHMHGDKFSESESLLAIRHQMTPLTPILPNSRGANT